jgi:coproporphyrinogen III oxidase-like Fe-S oxidoreductase
VDLAALGESVTGYKTVIEELVTDGLLLRSGTTVQLTTQGRLLSNEVFGLFISDLNGLSLHS